MAIYDALRHDAFIMLQVLYCFRRQMPLFERCHVDDAISFTPLLSRYADAPFTSPAPDAATLSLPPRYACDAYFYTRQEVA